MSEETARGYCPICAAEVEMPVDTIAAMSAAPAQIADAVQAAPGGGAGWSPAEVATHLADTEVVTGWRLRQILAADTPTLQPYDQEKWAAGAALPAAGPGLGAGVVRRRAPGQSRNTAAPLRGGVGARLRPARVRSPDAAR